MNDQNEFEKMSQAEQTAYLNQRAKDKGMCYNSGGILKGNSTGHSQCGQRGHE